MINLDNDFIEIMRKKLNLKYTEIALKINMLPGQLASIICEGEEPITLKQACDLAELFHCEPYHLFLEPENVQCFSVEKTNFIEKRKVKRSKQK